MSDHSSYRAIIGPRVTEKASLGNQQGTYVFVVSPRANKIEIARAIEKLYNVTVRQVRILHVPAKHRRVGNREGEKAGYKKAFISLRAGETIDMS